jgi:hypothetical protein
MLKQGTLLTFLGEVKDPRRLQGQRYKPEFDVREV